LSQQTELWDAWCMCRYGSTDMVFTQNERGKLNAAIKQWVEVSATPTILKQKYSAYRSMFPKLPKPTPQALCNQWNALGHTKTSPQASYVPPIGKPTEAGYKHAIDCLPKDIQRRLRLKHEGHT